MFMGQISDWTEQRRYCPPAVVAAFEEALQQDIENLEEGRYELKNVAESFFLVQTPLTKKVEATRPEAHRKFIDVQLLLRGREKYGIAQPERDLAPLENLFDEKDIAFYPAPAFESFVVLEKGQFVVFFPGELHRPLCRADAEEKIRKIVVKIPVRALEG